MRPKFLSKYPTVDVWINSLNFTIDFYFPAGTSSADYTRLCKAFRDEICEEMEWKVDKHGNQLGINLSDFESEQPQISLSFDFTEI